MSINQNRNLTFLLVGKRQFHSREIRVNHWQLASRMKRLNCEQLMQIIMERASVFDEDLLVNFNFTNF